MVLKQWHRLDDIISWVETFTVFSLVLTSYFPNHWLDITQYKLLILRTYRQFSGRVWLNYDQAFREHAAATKLVDWSSMNVQLYNFHSAGASVCSLPGKSSSESAEQRGSSSSQVVCKSWNASCRFAHRCSSCSVPITPIAAPAQTTGLRRSTSTDLAPQNLLSMKAASTGSTESNLGLGLGLRGMFFLCGGDPYLPFLSPFQLPPSYLLLLVSALSMWTSLTWN